MFFFFCKAFGVFIQSKSFHIFLSCVVEINISRSKVKYFWYLKFNGAHDVFEVFYVCEPLHELNNIVLHL